MNVFYNSEEERLRAGWRIFLQLVLLAFFSLPLVFFADSLEARIGMNLTYLAAFLGFILSVWVAVRFLDKRPLRSLGIDFDKRWRNEFLFGFLAGGVVMTVIFAIELSFGWIDFTGFGWERAWSLPYILPFLGYLIGMLLVGFYEELVFRGYQILNMTEGLTGDRFSSRQAALIAVGISSAIFGILHAGNPNAGVISTVNIIVAGVVLAVPYIITGSLSLSVGIHASWNFFQGGIFGFPVSGMITRSSLIQVRETGPDFLTGGSFGPEAGLLGVFGLLLLFLCLYFYLVKAGYELRVHERFENDPS